MKNKTWPLFIVIIVLIGFFSYRYIVKKNNKHFAKFRNPHFEEQNKIKNRGQVSVPVDQIKSPKEDEFRSPSSRPSLTEGDVTQSKKIEKTLKHINPKKLIFSDLPSAHWESEGVQYQLIKNLMAIKEEDFIPMQYESVGKFNGYYLVKKDTDDYERSALAVVYNEDTKGVAIFTGILKIKFLNFEQASVLDEMVYSKLGPNIPMQLVEEYPHINLAFYKFDNFSQTMMVYELLRSETLSNMVERVTIDLLEWHRVTR